MGIKENEADTSSGELETLNDKGSGKTVLAIYTTLNHALKSGKALTFLDNTKSN